MAEPMLLDTLRDLAKLYTEYNPGYRAISANTIGADLRDLYKNGNLADVFPYLDELDDETMEEEVNLINEVRYLISDQVKAIY